MMRRQYCLHCGAYVYVPPEERQPFCSPMCKERYKWKLQALKGPSVVQFMRKIKFRGGK